MATLPAGLSAQQVRHAEDLKPLSCVICRRRKLKCDRRDPCSRCLKSRVECIYPEPVRSRHQRKPELVLIARLKHYENLLRKNGIDPNIIDSDSCDDGVSVEDEAEKSSDANNQATEGQFLSKGGKSIYFDKYGLSIPCFQPQLNR